VAVESATALSGLERRAADPSRREVAVHFPFGRTKELEAQVDQFLDVVTKGTLCMREAVASYLGGDDQDFRSRLGMLRDYEHLADDLRKSTETTLNRYSLIPESSADVMRLIDNLDDVVDCAKHIVLEFDVQRPDVEARYLDLVAMLTEKSVHAVEHAVDAARCFLRNESRLRECIAKVEFYEKEADQTGLRLKRMIYESDMDLARKNHLRYFADALESLSDLAEGVVDHLLIASIRRSA
jgi:predicted phosphate transport protein (TIGR00153 family)